MKYHVTIKDELDADGPEAAALAFVRMLHERDAVQVDVTGPPRTGTTTVYVQVTGDEAKVVAAEPLGRTQNAPKNAPKVFKH